MNKENIESELKELKESYNLYHKNRDKLLSSLEKIYGLTNEDIILAASITEEFDIENISLKRLDSVLRKVKKNIDSANKKKLKNFKI
ncbi:MAG: hypothetical protein WC758_08450 [Candidatus Woesearchaeota archaeon]|jgi:hypothetical protein